MSYFLKGHQDSGDEVDDFDEYDPTPYGGGYDVFLTYGRPLPPSDEICYPNTSSTSDDFDYDRPLYTSYAEPSAYGDEALDNEYKGYARPKPRPAPPSHEGEGEYGFDGGSGHGRSEYGRTEPEYGEPESECGSGYGGRHENPESEYGRKPELEEPSSENGSGYGRDPEYESGYGRKGEYEEPSSEYESVYGKPEPEYGRSEYGSGYGRNPESEDYGSGRGPARAEYGEEKPSYETEEYQRPGYERSEEEDYRHPPHERPDDDDDGEICGREKYGEYKSYDDSDNEEKSNSYKYRKDYDD